MKAKYCKCLNTYTIDKCKKKRCSAPDYWAQGYGSEGRNENPATINQIDTSNTNVRVATNEVVEERQVNIIRVTR